MSCPENVLSDREFPSYSTHSHTSIVFYQQRPPSILWEKIFADATMDPLLEGDYYCIMCDNHNNLPLPAIFQKTVKSACMCINVQSLHSIFPFLLPADNKIMTVFNCVSLITAYLTENDELFQQKILMSLTCTFTCTFFIL